MVIFLDLSKSFDKLHCDDVMFKLKQGGISSNFLTLCNFSRNVKERLVSNEKLLLRLRLTQEFLKVSYYASIAVSHTYK